jgi:hypothetical protein
MSATETRIRDLEEQLSATADDAQLANIDLQNMLQKQQQTLQRFSQMSKMTSDTARLCLAESASPEHAGALDWNRGGSLVPHLGLWSY